jgi:NodT family efflux transporter outer membrane factor (OMF) lipoprotein
MSKAILRAGLWSLPAALALALAAGCDFAPKYKVPPLALMPPAYKETNGWKTAAPADAVLKGKWWEIYNDPQLNALEDHLTVSNQNIVAAFENFLGARYLVKEAESQLYPTVTAQPEYTRTKPSANGGITVGSTGSGTSKPYSQYYLPLDASWEPDLWGSIRNTVKASTYSAQVSAAQLENLRLTLQAELAVDFYELRAQDELIDLYSNTIVSYKDSLDLTKTLFDAGIDSDLDVAQADSQLQTTLAQATALGIQRAQYEHAIALLLSQPASTFSLKPAPRAYKPPSVPVGLPAQLLERRPDIAAAERSLAASNAVIGVDRAAYFPTVTLTGTAGLQSSTMSKLLESSSFYWMGAAAASETIFDAGRRKAVTEQAWASYRAGVANYRQTVLTAFQQVEDDLAALRILSTQSGQQDVAVQAAQKNLDLAVQRYRLGINSYLNIVTAQVSLLGNQQTAVTIHMQQMTSSVQLIMALGGGWTTNDLPTPKRVKHDIASQ